MFSDDTSPSRSDKPQSKPLETKRSSDRLVNGTSKRPSSRRPSDDEPKLDKTTKTSLFSRKDSRETNITRSTKVTETEERDSKFTSRYNRRGSEEKKTTLFSRRDSGDKKTILSRRDSSDKKTPLPRRDSGETKPASSTPSRFTPRSTATKPSDKSKAGKPEGNSIYSEPLRHQKGALTQRTSTKQTDVEKIVSPYGVGPTDENGMPLFGLRALKKKKQQAQQPAAGM